MLTLTHEEQRLEFIRNLKEMQKIKMFRLKSEMPQAEAVLLMTLYFREKEQPDGVQVSDLLSKSNMSGPAVSRLMKKMEENGIIERKIDPKDRRNILVNTTEKGEQLNRENMRDVEKTWDSVLSRVPLEDIEELLRIWGEVIRAMKEVASSEEETI